MPELCRFYNIVIKMIFSDNDQHHKPHFHVYYVEYEEDGATYKMWIENTKSIEEKINLAKQYNLAGIAFWEKDREENDEFWTQVKEALNK